MLIEYSKQMKASGACMQNIRFILSENYKFTVVNIVGTHSALFRYTLYIPWENWLAFHEYACGRGDQSSSNEIACYNKILFNLLEVLLGFSYLK